MSEDRVVGKVEQLTVTAVNSSQTFPGGLMSAQAAESTAELKARIQSLEAELAKEQRRTTALCLHNAELGKADWRGLYQTAKAELAQAKSIIGLQDIDRLNDEIKLRTEQAKVAALTEVLKQAQEVIQAYSGEPCAHECTHFKCRTQREIHLKGVGRVEMSNRAPIDTILDGLSWKVLREVDEVPKGGELYATHEGVLNIAGFDFHCYQLSDGSRVFDADDVRRLFEGLK